MIHTECIFYCDVRYMLYEKVDIVSEVKDQICQQDWALDDIRDQLDEDLVDKFDEADVMEILKYIHIYKDNAEVDYEETAILGDLSIVAFRTAIAFDDEKFRNSFEPKLNPVSANEFNNLIVGGSNNER